VEGGNFCVDASSERNLCAGDDDCADLDDFAYCGTRTGCGEANKVCFLPFPK
jgi:hypothetical protein